MPLGAWASSGASWQLLESEPAPPELLLLGWGKELHSTLLWRLWSGCEPWDGGSLGTRFCSVAALSLNPRPAHTSKESSLASWWDGHAPELLPAHC